MDLNYTETHGLFHPLARKPTFTVSLGAGRQSDKVEV